jgi:hypothetical protein
MQLESYHREENSSAFFFHFSSVGCHKSVGANLFQIVSQVIMIIECTVEGAIL